MQKDRIAPVDLRFVLKIDGVDSLDRSLKKIDHDRSHHMITKRHRFDQKTVDRIPNPGSMYYVVSLQFA